MDAAAVNHIVQQALQQQHAALQQQMNAAVAAAVAAAAAAPAAAAPVAGLDAQQFAAFLAQSQQQSAQQVQQIVNQLVPQVAAAASAQRGQQPRFAAPTTFDGRSGTFDEWKADMLRQFEWYNTPGDADRIRVAAAHLKGAAGDWWTSLAAASRPSTWVALIAALETRFQPINSAELARSQLYALVQGKKTVNEYIDSFRRLLGRLTSAQGQIDMAASDQLLHFRKGLRPAIALQIDMQGITTLDAAINLAVRVGSRIDMAASSNSNGSSSSGAPMELDNIEGLEGDTSATNNADAPVTQSQLKLLLAAMQDNRRGGRGAGAGSSSSSGGGNNRHHGGRSYGLPRMPHLTEDQVKEYMAAGKCFGCGATDHTSRGCPKRKKGPDGRVSWSN
jgi:hypothetical protein